MVRVKNTVTVGTSKYSYFANDIYGGLAGVTGVTRAPSPDNTVYTDSLTKENFGDGIVTRLKARAVTGTPGTAGAKYKDFTIVCTAEKLKPALAGLPSKTITVGSVTWDIVGARVPGRRRFS
jgi:hypothetical protein